MNPFAELTLDQLRARRSVKWRTHDPDVLPLFVAEMDTPLAPPIAAALSAAVERGDTGYAHSGDLATAFADFAMARWGLAVDPGRSRVMPDVLNGILNVLNAVTERGAGVVINPPVYPPFFSFLERAERRIVEVSLRQPGYQLDLDGLERCFASGAASAYLLCNPHNPTGSVFPRDDLLSVVALCERFGVRLLVDEIHAPLAYPGVVPVSTLTLTDRVFVFTSASKAWNLPGLKASLVVTGDAGQEDLERIPIEASFGSGLFGVLAGEAAYRAGVPWLDDALVGLDENRRLLGDLLAEHLPTVGYEPPDATYLAWLDCRALGLDEDLAAVFLERGRVALVSGPSFGAPGTGYVRLNFATSPEILTEAVRRMASAVRT